MCGIVGVVGNRNATDILMQGLEKLEYRGYDSAGIFVTTGKKGSLVKSVGRILHFLYGRRGLYLPRRGRELRLPKGKGAGNQCALAEPQTG